MPIYGKVSGVWQTSTAPYVRVAGVWQPLTAAYAKVSGTWQQVYTAVGPLSANLAPGSVSATGTGNGPFTTDSCTCSASGGVAPYGYAWEFVSGSGSISATAGSSATTAFSASGTAPTTITGAWRCKVTDSAATTAFTGNVSISVTLNVAALTGSASPTSCYGSINNTFGTCPTSITTAAGSGGVAPYTYAWEYVSGDASITATNLPGPATNFIRSGPGGFVDRSFFAAWRCKVTDNLGTVAYTNNVNVETDFFAT